MSIPCPPPPGEEPTAYQSGSQGKKIRIGICAMNRKATSKPMRAIMSKIVDYYKDWLEYFIFPESVIIHEPVDRWPLCDCLISFHSTDFPLHKAIEYVKLRKPYVINDLKRQYDLLDRRKVFRTLAKEGIEHPRHGVLMRKRFQRRKYFFKFCVLDGILVEHNDHIEVNGMVFNKPFVEKPVSAEDHNIYIYYPSSVGGGSQRLFPKAQQCGFQINNRSSWYSPVSEVRKDGSYIYEDFIPADGTDVKVYAVGPYYAHAEARKAPGLDGKVERDADGKEVRYPVILSHKEKMIARRVVLAFGQTVCGFDLLRANGKSYVCDVNGFSFVKTSTKYYEDTAKILGNTIMRRLATTMSVRIPYQLPVGEQEAPPLLDLGLGDDPPIVSTPSGKLMELRCVLAVIVHDERFFALFKKYDGFKKNEIKMKRPNQLMEVLELAREILAEHIALRNSLLTSMEAYEDSGEESQRVEHELEEVEEAIKRWDQMRAVLEMYDEHRSESGDYEESDTAGTSSSAGLVEFSNEDRLVMECRLDSAGEESHTSDDSDRSDYCRYGHFSGINRKVQLKYLKAREFRSGENEETQQQGPALMLILKWGGELTTAGNLQAEALGKLFRTLYPGIRRADGKSSPEDTQGLGFLRLHSTYRHDLKIYASDEGRVQMTAAAFAKGMLALEGELTPILMQMVKSANTDGLLDDDCHARDFQSELKGYLHQALQVDRDWTPEDYQALNPDGLKSINNAMEFIRNPKKMCHEIAGYVQRMCDIINHNKYTKPHRTLYLNETWDLAERRWGKELREFRRENKGGDVEYDISKIPDIYDNIKYDMEHNPDLCVDNEGEFERMYVCVKNMADIVVPQEYGIRKENKICVAQRVCTPLLKKIRNDLHRCIECSEEDESQTRLDPRASEGIATPLRHVRTRLYFTSESHIHTLMNLIRYGGLCSVDDKKWQRAMNFLSGVTEFNYMTQVVLMVYEDSRTDSTATGTERFHIELLFSPGLYPCFLTEKERIYENRLNKSNGMTKSHSREGNCNGSVSPSSAEVVKEKNEEPQPIFISVPVPADDVSVSSANDDQKAAETTGLVSSSSKMHQPDSEDDLNDAHSVNLVALDEVNTKQYRGDVEYDISKIPDIYDNIKYDMEHNPDLCVDNEGEFERMYVCVKNMADIVVPQCSEEDESQTRLDPRASEGIATPLRHVRTRLYFTSESHIHTLMNLIRYGGLCSVDDKKWQRAMNFLSGVTEFNYMTQVVLMVYEDSRTDSTATGTERFHIELLFSPGLYPCFLTEKERIYENRLNKSNGMTKSHSREGNCNGSVSPSSAEVVKEKNEEPQPIFISVPVPADDVSVSSANDDQKAAETTGLVSSSSKMHQPDSEDDLNDAHSVNLVALDEVNTKQYPGEEKIGKRQRHATGGEKASEEGDLPREDLTLDWKQTNGLMKSPSQVSVGDEECQATVGHGRGKWANELVDETRKAMNSITEVEEKQMERKDSTSLPNTDHSIVADEKSRRSRFPYRFKHHTVNLLTGGSGSVQNRLISTNVLMGKCGGDHSDKNRRQTYIPNPAVMSTAVIARSSSAPRLQTYKAEDDISVGEIRRFWPPLRSLETLHDSLSFMEFDRFLTHLLSTRTPLPSPPKTPLLLTHEDSVDANMKGIQEEVERLRALGINDKKLL
ncbi:histidine acid phosphatase [Ostertagia ostertagi]